MQRQAFLDLVGELFERRPGTLKASDALDSLEWDSLKALEFITLVDDRLDGYQVAPEELFDCRTVGELLDLVGEKLQ